MRSKLFFEEDGKPIRFRVGMTHLEDGAFLLDIARNIRSIYFEDKGLYHRRIHEESAMNKLDLERLVNKMLHGYGILLESTILKENHILMQYAQNAYLRAVKYYLKQCMENNMNSAVELIRIYFDNDDDLKDIINEINRGRYEVIN